MYSVGMETKLTFEDWKFSEELEAEIQYHINMHEDDRDPTDPEDGPRTRADVVQELMQDMDMPHHIANEFKDELRAFGRTVGIFRHYTKKQLENVQVSSGKKWDHKHKGEAYLFEGWEPLGIPQSTNV